jgi:hypothetical protein
MASQKFTAWFGTLKLGDSEVPASWGTEEYWKSHCKPFKGIMIGEHVGQQTGYRHLHIALCVKYAVTMSFFKKLMKDIPHWNSMHCEKIRANSVSEVFNYLNKDGKCFSVGDVSFGQGNRFDLKQMCDSIKEKGLKKTIDLMPDKFILYNRGMIAYANHCSRNQMRLDQVCVFLYGPTGCGKTRSMYDMGQPLDETFKPIILKDKLWFDGYCQEFMMLFDDMHINSINPTFLLQLFDVYPMRVEVKGCSVNLQSKIMAVTSNESFEQWIENLPVVNKEAMRRRFHYIIRMDEDGEAEFEKGNAADFRALRTETVQRFAELPDESDSVTEVFEPESSHEEPDVDLVCHEPLWEGSFPDDDIWLPAPQYGPDDMCFGREDKDGLFHVLSGMDSD